MDEEMKTTPESPIAEAPAPETAPEATGMDTQNEVKALIQKYIPGSEGGPEDNLKLLKMLDNLHDKILVSVENDPDFGAALSDILNGETARVALARNYGPDAFQAVEGDPDYDLMTENFNKAKERIGKKRQMAEQIAKNQEMSVKEIQAWMEEKGYDDVAIQARLNKLEEIRQDFLNDKINRNHLQLIDKAMDFDTAVAQAEQAGKVAGRNEQIVEKREKRATAGDGLPSLTAQNAKPEKPKSYAANFLKGVM